jgi:hypothetical protein
MLLRDSSRRLDGIKSTCRIQTNHCPVQQTIGERLGQLMLEGKNNFARNCAGL